MKTVNTIAVSLVAIGLFAGAASAKDIFADINATAPKSYFDMLRDTAPRSPFDQLNATAPRTYFDILRDTAPRSDGVFGTLQDSAP